MICIKMCAHVKYFVLTPKVHLPHTPLKSSDSRHSWRHTKMARKSRSWQFLGLSFNAFIPVNIPCPPLPQNPRLSQWRRTQTYRGSAAKRHVISVSDWGLSQRAAMQHALNRLLPFRPSMYLKLSAVGGRDGTIARMPSGRQLAGELCVTQKVTGPETFCTWRYLLTVVRWLASVCVGVWVWECLCVSERGRESMRINK